MIGSIKLEGEEFKIADNKSPLFTLSELECIQVPVRIE